MPIRLALSPSRSPELRRERCPWLPGFEISAQPTRLGPAMPVSGGSGGGR